MSAAFEVCPECIDHCTLCGAEVVNPDNDRCDRCIAAYFAKLRRL